MGHLRRVLCCFGLVLALAPAGAFAETARDHHRAELLNAQAQLGLAEQQAVDIANLSALSAANEREIAFLKSEALREAQLSNSANAIALEQIANALAQAIRDQGTVNAQNEMAILQIKAGTLIAKADATMANALAMGKPQEIANAQAQSAALHQLADFLTGVQAQQNMANDLEIADNAATAVQDDAMVEAQNDEALGANELFAADTILDAAQVAVSSATIEGNVASEVLLAHAEASLANAEAMLAEDTP
jgi:hypothetical protein